MPKYSGDHKKNNKKMQDIKDKKYGSLKKLFSFGDDDEKKADKPDLDKKKTKGFLKGFNNS